MRHNFAAIVEDVQQLSPEEKDELLGLLEKYVIEERREEILENYQGALQELKEGKLVFSSSPGLLKEMLSHD
jgi:hypothetical protein